MIPTGSGHPSEAPSSAARIQLRFDRFAAFVEAYSGLLSLGGMMVRSATPHPVGSRLEVEASLADGFQIFSAVGEVIWVQPPDPGEPGSGGMGVRFKDVDEGGRDLILKIFEEHVKAGGTPFEVEHLPPGASATPPPPPSPPPAEAPPAAAALADEKPAEERPVEQAAFEDRLAPPWGDELPEPPLELDALSDSVELPALNELDIAAGHESEESEPDFGSWRAAGSEAPASERVSSPPSEPSHDFELPELEDIDFAIEDDPLDPQAAGTGSWSGDGLDPLPTAASVKSGFNEPALDLSDERGEESQLDALPEAAALQADLAPVSLGEPPSAASAAPETPPVAEPPLAAQAASTAAPRSSQPLASKREERQPEQQSQGLSAAEVRQEAPRLSVPAVKAPAVTSLLDDAEPVPDTGSHPPDGLASAPGTAPDDDEDGLPPAPYWLQESAGAASSSRRRRLQIGLGVAVLAVILGSVFVFRDTLFDRQPAASARRVSASAVTPPAGRPAPAPPVDSLSEKASEAGEEAARQASSTLPPPSLSAPPLPLPPSPQPSSRSLSAATQIEAIRWTTEGARTRVTITANGPLPAAQVSRSRLGGEPIRELIVIKGIIAPFDPTSLEVGNAHLTRIRVGFHPELEPSALHIVLDLSGAGISVEAVEAGPADRLELLLTP